MKKHAIVVILVSSSVVPASCAEKSSDCADTRDCPGVVVTDAGQDVIQLPRDCNFEEVCPIEGAGFFVSPTGSDEGDGTKARPFKTFARALGRYSADAGKDAGKSDAGTDAGASEAGVADAGTSPVRIFACAGQYSEDVQVDGDLEIYGGFSCSDWKFTGIHPQVVGARPLRIDGVKRASLSDIEFRALPAERPGASSIAGFITNSTVLVKRATFVAGPGKEGEDRPGTAPFSPSQAPDSGATGTVNPLCFTSASGFGGQCTKTAGERGRPYYPQPVPEGATGAGGIYNGDCQTTQVDGTRGSDGVGGGGAGASASRVGVLRADGWTPGSGTNGLDGAVGQGGGGSTGDDGACEAGSGGALGGCGGRPGLGAPGGGSSIALAVYRSQVNVDGSQLHAAVGGRGGNGGGGGQGQAAGPRITKFVCANRAWGRGGDGGAGGGGGGGGGGAGGLSVGIVWTGTAPIVNGQAVLTAATFDGVSVASGGAGGSPGAGGLPGNGGDPRVSGRSAVTGIAGVAQAILGMNEDGSIVTGDRP